MRPRSPGEGVLPADRRSCGSGGRVWLVESFDHIIKRTDEQEEKMVYIGEIGVSSLRSRAQS